jgi:hypothetical protein
MVLRQGLVSAKTRTWTYRATYSEEDSNNNKGPVEPVLGSLNQRSSTIG